MKEQIMEKLFSSVELTNEEIVYIGRNLGETLCAPCSFNHGEKDITVSCGVTQEDCDDLNKALKAHTEVKDYNNISEFIERFEMVVTSNPKFLRIIIMNYISLISRRPDPLLSLLLGGLGGRF